MVTLKYDTTKVPFVDLATQYSAIAGEVGEATGRVLRNADFI
jgi:hypothetical protein